MYVTLTPDIKIGAYRFQSVTDVHIDKSMSSFVDTATIKVPATAMLVQAGERVTAVDTATKFAQGDKVTVQLGYSGRLETEFKGFVKRIFFGMPCVVECEGYSWQLRKTVIAKSYSDGSVNKILQDLINGTDITIHPETPVITYEGKIVFENLDGAQALEKLAKELLLTTYFINDNQLYVGPDFTAQTDKSVKYRFGWNTIKDDVAYRSEDDMRVRIKVEFKDAKGKTRFATYGKKGGVEEVLKLGVCTDANRRKQIVNQKAREYRYGRHEGSITAFLEPYCQPGWKVVTQDDKFPERSSIFIAVSTQVQFGTSGARRTVTINELPETYEQLQEN